ncbi:MAG: response regulator [Bryobacteraceae bacterium]
MRNSTAPSGLEVVRWLRACPGNRFPILGYANDAAKREFDQDLFRQLFDTQLEPFHCYVDLGRPAIFPKVMFVESLSNQVASSMAEDLARLADIRLRHGFPQALIAAVRFLLGAVRCGAVPIDRGQRLLASLSHRANQAGTGEGLDGELLRWYIQTRSVGIPQPGETGISGRCVLLLDDEAERNGWSAVFAEVFGAEFVAVRTPQAALQALAGAVFDLALVDIRLIDPNSSMVFDGVSFIHYVRRKHLEMPIIAFSCFDESDTTQRALRAGADWYFAKSLESPLDRDSEDYFRKLCAIVSECPHRDSPMRRFWRKFSKLEESLRRLGTASDSQSDLCCEFFRLAYFFGAEKRALGDRSRSLDVRQEALFGRPEYAAQPALSAAVRLLIAKINGSQTSQDVGFYESCCEAFRRLKVPINQWRGLYEPWGLLQRARHNRRVLTPKRFCSAMESFLLVADRATHGGRAGAREANPPHGFVKTRPAAGNEVMQPGLAGEGAEGARKAWVALGSPKLELPEACYLIVDPEGRKWAKVLGEITGRHFQVYEPINSESWHEPLRQRLRVQPAVVWLGIRNLGKPAIKLIRSLKSEFFSDPILVATETFDSVSVRRAFRNGASAYVWTGGLGRESVEHLTSLISELRRLGELANVASAHSLWRNIVQIRAKAASDGGNQLLQDCADLLAIAYFCHHPDSDPHEEWKSQILVPSSAHLALAFWMVGRAAECITDVAEARLSQSQRSQMVAVVQARNIALYGGDGGPSLRKCAKIVCDVLRSL